MGVVSYARILRRFGLAPRLRYPWAIVGNPAAIQGWKLHVSSIQTEARQVLRTLVPLLAEKKAAFKVAQDEIVLALLNEGEFGSTQVGKFMTVYPESDEHALELAELLIARSSGFCGPEIITDLHLGGTVYSRYGGFNPTIARDRLGRARAMIHGRDGGLVEDRYAVPFVPPQDVRNPFAALCHSNGKATEPAAPSQRLIGPGYLVIEAIKARPHGGAFLALDLRSQETASLKVLKLGRHHCLSDKYGRDIRDRLRRQAILQRSLAARVPMPQADQYFETEGHGYLPIEHLEGSNLEDLVSTRRANRIWSELEGETRQELLRYLRDTVDAVVRLHEAGYVHRDLSPSNIWIGADGGVYLLDPELAHAIGDPAPPFGMGTAGFMSPQQQALMPPEFADDVFSIGAVISFVLTGLDPRRTVFKSDPYRRRRMTRLASGAPAVLVHVMISCLSTARERRPHLTDVRAALSEALLMPDPLDREVRYPSPPIAKAAPSGSKALMRALLDKGQQALLGEFAARPGGLWLSANPNTQDGRAAGVYTVERYANRGVAGIVYLLARLARFGHGRPEAATCVQQAVTWLIDSQPREEDRLPGLHFGEAGVAVALSEAIAAGYIGRDARADRFIRTSLVARTDWPDITHGAAGQGLAALCCADRLEDSTLAESAHGCADFLIATQSDDGSWRLPEGVDGLSGDTLTGFAHGAAGIIFFLAEYADRFGRRAAEDSLQRAAQWLLSQAIEMRENAALEWPYSTSDPHRWRWWCHGAPGIALAFLKLYQRSGDSSHAETARRALRSCATQVRHANLSQCHGLSGLGEIYLEASRVLGDAGMHAEAERIGDELVSRARQQRDGAVSWLAEDPYLETGDLMIGYGGILHFLLGLHESDATSGMPLSVDSHAA